MYLAHASDMPLGKISMYSTSSMRGFIVNRELDALAIFQVFIEYNVSLSLFKSLACELFTFL